MCGRLIRLKRFRLVRERGRCCRGCRPTGPYWARDDEEMTSSRDAYVSALRGVGLTVPKRLRVFGEPLTGLGGGR